MPADVASRDQVFKDWVRRDLVKPMHTQGPPPHANQAEVARPLSSILPAESYRPTPTHGPLWQRQQPLDVARSRRSLQTSQAIDGRLATLTAAGPSLPGGKEWTNATDSIRIYRPPATTRILPQKKKMDALGTSVGWQSSIPPAVPTPVYNPLTHATHVVTRADAHGNGATVDVHAGVEVYRQMTAKDLSKDVWHGRRKGVATWEDLVHPFAVNQNKEFRQGFRAEPKPYHPVTGEMSAWMHNAYESRTRIPFTGKYPS
ncbi:hypothetical protein KFE25_002358 [Diacronema lutheri]|uniref:Uncharacterized protein n=1 Tax=Diacronema lutheri TaxID=2081491 RepID=A0A8J6C5L5_DIALT|nr:hypothetical protein KFE25_002358 [Diacronema lutheri]